MNSKRSLWFGIFIISVAIIVVLITSALFMFNGISINSEDFFLALPGILFFAFWIIVFIVLGIIAYLKNRKIEGQNKQDSDTPRAG